jgi:hypothetical protein
MSTRRVLFKAILSPREAPSTSRTIKKSNLWTSAACPAGAFKTLVKAAVVRNGVAKKR